MDLPPLKEMLECIPPHNRQHLDKKLEDRKSRVMIARSLRNWKIVAQYLPNIENDTDTIENDNPNNLELQQVALLDKWLQRNGPWATYRTLAECLYEARAIESLQVLCKELGGNLQPAAGIQAGKAHSPQYQAVLQYKEQLAKSLADGPDQHLLNQFKLSGWLGEGAYRSAPELIDVALTRIWSSVSDYEVFIRMLPDNDRVKAVVIEFTGNSSGVVVEKRDPDPLQLKQQNSPLMAAPTETGDTDGLPPAALVTTSPVVTGPQIDSKGWM
ncbi:hypothetical protein GBAR_LOCUS13258 [Geodia barretti]|uniref:Death domain-containing protein n=1 Tax=Geodia barretti TaxID=519541 RepID=A0AA35S376_GEOBA|nr:hypothetical protein GBAR_LOCUS13258 [Geodia barretti]